MIPPISDPVVKSLALDACRGASDFLKRGYAKEDELEAARLLASGELDHYRIATVLRSYANFTSRIGIGALLQGRQPTVSLRECWRLVGIASEFRELEMIAQAERFPTNRELFDEVSVHWLPSDVLDLAFSVWKLYCLGEQHDLARFRSYFELFDLRQDVTRILAEEELESYDVAVCVSLFMSRGDTSAEDMRRLLEPLPVFKGFIEAWGDDGKFARFTNLAAQWHLTHSLRHTGQFTCFADVAADVLIPSWVIALDVFRQRSLGRPSCLGDHELLRIGRTLLEGAALPASPTGIYLPAKKALEVALGGLALAPLEFWKRYLDQNAH